MTRKLMVVFLVFAALTQINSLKVRGNEAKAFSLSIPNSEAIDVATDHYSVSVVQGYVSEKDSFMQKLLSSNDKLVISISSNVALFNVGDSLNYSLLYDNQNISKNVGRSWGQNQFIVDNVPADSDANVTIQLTINKSDQLTKVFDSLQSSKAALPTDLFASQWYGYAVAVDGLVKALFGTDKNTIPFYWSGSMKNVSGATSAAWQARYIILIAPQKDADADFQTLDGTKFSFDENSQRLLYDNKQDMLKGRSYVLLKVAKAGIMLLNMH